MTYLSYVPRLLTLTPNGPIAAVAARAEEPVGLALAEIAPEGDTATVLSLFVADAFRRRGIGTQLLRQLEDELRRRGVHQAVQVFASEKASTPALEKLLDRRGWGVARPRMFLCQARRQALLALRDRPLLRRRPFPPGYTVIPWREVTAQERQRVGSWLESGLAPAYVNPFREEEKQDAATSLALRHQGELVGWLITHRIAPETLRFTNLFVREDTIKGLGMQLAVEMLHRHFETATGPEGEVCWAFYGGTPLVEFFQRRVMPLLPEVRIVRTMERVKRLADRRQP